MTVLVKYPKLAIGMIGLTWAATGGFAIYQYCQPSPSETYRKGVDDGYKKARQELREQGLQSMKTSILYAEKNLETVQNGQVLDSIYMKDSLFLWQLPTWNVKLLGDEYVVHMPFKKEYRTAWITTKESSENFLSILKTILETKYKETDIEHMQRNSRSNHYLTRDT
jgi:hypothetical protein